MDLEMKSTDRNLKMAADDNDNQPSSRAIDIADCKGLVIGEDEIHQRVCRICHLSAKESGTTPTDQLMEIGCGCKGELGIAHSHCAEAWFKVRGIRLCEICSETAKNITGVGDTAVFMEEWNENRADEALGASSHGNRCLGGHLCNFLMACLVIAFMLPWFLHVDMF